MSKSFTKALCLLVTLAMLVSYAVLPVYAETTASVSQPVSEPAASDTAVTGDSPAEENPAGTSETAPQQLPVIPNEPIAQAPAGGENEVLFSVPLVPKGSVSGDEPVTGSAKTALLDVIINYPSGKSALQTGDIVTLLFKIVDFADNDAVNGTTIVNGKTVEKGIGAYKLSLVYNKDGNNNFVLSGTPESKFTTTPPPNTPYALFDQSNNAATSTVNMVAVFSTFRNNKVEALNEAALLAADGLLATVKLKFTGTGDTALDMDFNCDLEYVKDGGTTESYGGGTTRGVTVDTAGPAMTVTDQKSDIVANQTKAVPLKSVLAPGDSVDPNAEITITDTHEITKFTVQKGTAAYKAEDTNSDLNKVKFELTEPGTYKITATDAVGNISEGMVLVKPRVTDLKLALTGTTYQRDTFTVTPTLVPAITTAGLPADDKALIWEVSWQGDAAADSFLTADGKKPSEIIGFSKLPDKIVGGVTVHYINWPQQAAAPIKFTSTDFNVYTITARTVKTFAGTVTPRGIARLHIKSPVKVLELTMAPDGNKKNLSSVTPGDSVWVSGYIKTQLPIPPGDSVFEKFGESGNHVLCYTSNETAKIRDDSFRFTKVNKVLNTYYYTMALDPSTELRGVCDVYLSCGDKTAVTSIDVNNYNTALSKMVFNQKSGGLDHVSNTTSNFTLSLSDSAGKTIMAANPNDCYFSSTNSSLLKVVTDEKSATTAQVSVQAGARSITAPIKVTITAELKNDPQKRKATTVYTVFPTERHTGVTVEDITVSNDKLMKYAPAPSGADYSRILSITCSPAEAMLFAKVYSPTLLSGEAYINPSNKSLVKFSSSSNSVATVSDTGVITVKGYGECFITVAAQDGSNTFDRIRVVSHREIDYVLSSNAKDLTIQPGQTIQLKLSGVLPGDAPSKVNLPKATWSKSGKDSNKFILNEKTGLVTVPVGTSGGTEVLITAKVEDKYFDISKDQFVVTYSEANFTINVQEKTKENLANLNAFTSLVASSPMLKIGDSMLVKVNNKAFTDYLNVKLSLGAEAPEVALEYGLNPEKNAFLIKTNTATTPGKRTLFASYMGKTITLPITVRDEATESGATMKLSIASPEYKLYDVASSGKMELTSTYYNNKREKVVLTVPGQSCTFSSSMPHLVKVDNNGNFTIDEYQASDLSANQPVTLYATVKGDPDGRKVSKSITVTPKLLTKQITLFGIYNERNYSLKDKNNICEIPLDIMKDPVFSLMVTETLRNDNTSTVMPNTAKSHFSGKPVFDESLKNALYGALTFSSTNPAVATVDANGLVTIKNPGTTTLKIAVANGLIGTTEPAVALEAVTLKVAPRYTVTLNQDVYTVKAGNTTPVYITAMKATTTPAGGKVTWTSSDDENFKVDPNTGRVTVKPGRKDGEIAKITATVPGDSDMDAAFSSYNILVSDADSVEKVTAKNTTLYAYESDGTPAYISQAGTIYFRTTAEINKLHISSSNDRVIGVGEVKECPNYNSPGKKGYEVKIVPLGPGTAQVIATIAGSTITETFKVYAFNNPAGNKLVVGSSLATQMLDSSNAYSAAAKQVLSSKLLDKNNAVLADFNKLNNEKYLTFTSSNPNLLAVEPDGTFYTRNLDTIKTAVNVDIRVAIKDEPTKREGKITFKVTPAVSASTVSIVERESGGYIKTISSSNAADLKNGGKAIYTDIGYPDSQRVFNLGATLDKTNGTKVMLADSSLITWASTNNSVAGVDANGTVTVRGKGTALITATAKDGSAVKDMVVIRVNNTPKEQNNVRLITNFSGNMEFAPVTIVAGGNYTIPYKLSTGRTGDYFIPNLLSDGADFEAYTVDGADKTAVKVDPRTGRITAYDNITTEKTDIVVTIHFKTNNIYYNNGGTEYWNNGAAYTNTPYKSYESGDTYYTVKVPIRVVPKAAATAKEISLYEVSNSAPTPKKLSSTINLVSSATYEFYIQQKDLANQVSPGTDAFISYERQNGTLLDYSGTEMSAGFRAALDSSTGIFTLTAQNVGTYKVYITLNGLTVTYTFNVFHPWYKDAGKTNLQPLTSAVSLTGMIADIGDGKIYGKLCPQDTWSLGSRGPVVRIVPTTGSCYYPGWDGYAESFTYTSSSPLVTVNRQGYVTLAEYIPAETTVTITATMRDDPARHKITIPIKITGQNLTRNMNISMGSYPITGQIITGYLANNSTLRLSADCTTDGTAPADNRNVVWSSNKTSVVTVDPTGKVKFVGAGTATVTAKAADGGGASAFITFNVSKNRTVSPT